MKRLKNKILSVFKSRKLNVFLLFFAIAFTILILTKLSKSYTGTIDFKIEPTNVDDSIVLLNTKDKTLKITFETFGFEWLKYAIQQPKLKVDFSTDVTKKDSIFIWSAFKGYSSINEQFNKDEKIKSINPDTLVFKFDLNAIKYVPVLLEANITYSQGFNSMELIKTQPDTVKLIGPASLLKEVSNITTQKIIINDLKASVNTLIGLQLDSLNPEIQLNPKQVNLKINVSKFTEGIVSIPIELINIPKGLKVNYFPKQVTISYSTSLENYKNITVQDFKVFCDFEDSKSNTFLIPSLIKQPKSIINARIQQQKIEFVITQ